MIFRKKAVPSAEESYRNYRKAVKEFNRELREPGLGFTIFLVIMIAFFVTGLNTNNYNKQQIEVKSYVNTNLETGDYKPETYELETVNGKHLTVIAKVTKGKKLPTKKHKEGSKKVVLITYIGGKPGKFKWYFDLLSRYSLNPQPQIIVTKYVED